MKVRGLGRLRRAVRWFRKRFRREALILLYHRVTELPSDLQLLAVTPQRFAEQLAYLRKHYYPVGLGELMQRLKERKIPKRAVVVTFDDGYADNLYQAKPLLERYDISATVFVTSGAMGQGGEFWWDELERILLVPDRLPETLQLNLNGIFWQWKLDSFSSRQRLYRELHGILRHFSEEKRSNLFQELLSWSGVATIARSTHRALSPDELIQLAKGGLVNLGAHTVTHPVLSTFPASVQRAEIYGSKADLERILGCPVVTFSYPYGSRSDYTLETISLVREAGFIYACSNFTGLVGQGTDYFQLPRAIVRNWNGEEFEQRLKKLFSR